MRRSKWWCPNHSQKKIVPWKSDINATSLLMWPKLQVDFSLISNVNDEILKQIFVVFKNMFVMFLDNDL
jgi:hypothetical protein